MALEDNVLGYWRLDEQSGVRDDFSPNGRDLTDTNTVTYAAGKFDNAAQFARANSEYLTGTDTALRITGEMSVQAWVYQTAAQRAANQASYGAGIMSHMSNQTIGDWWLSVDASRRPIFAQWENGGGADLDGRLLFAVSVTDDAWNHIVVSRSSAGGPSSVTMYVNGSSVSLSSTLSTDSGWGTQNFSIGRQYTTTAYYWDGLIDEAAVWNRALSASEVAQLYNSGNGLQLYGGGGPLLPGRLVGGVLTGAKLVRC